MFIFIILIIIIFIIFSTSEPEKDRQKYYRPNKGHSFLYEEDDEYDSLMGGDVDWIYEEMVENQAMIRQHEKYKAEYDELIENYSLDENYQGIFCLHEDDLYQLYQKPSILYIIEQDENPENIYVIKLEFIVEELFGKEHYLSKKDLKNPIKYEPKLSDQKATYFKRPNNEYFEATQYILKQEKLKAEYDEIINSYFLDGGYMGIYCLYDHDLLKMYQKPSELIVLQQQEPIDLPKEFTFKWLFNTFETEITFEDGRECIHILRNRVDYKEVNI